MYLTYPVGGLLPYNNLSTITVHVILFWLLGNTYVIAHTLMHEMDRNKKHAVIKYLNLKGLSAAEISTEFNSVLGENVPSDATIYR